VIRADKPVRRPSTWASRPCHSIPTNSTGGSPVPLNPIALFGIKRMRGWGITPHESSSVGEVVAKRVAADLLASGMLPEKERNDAMILGEAAFNGCDMLVSSDKHLLDVDAGRLRELLEGYGLGVPRIIAPWKIVRMFGGRR